MTVTHATGRVLGDANLALLEAVQEVLLPGDDEMPPASRTGAARAVDAYLAERQALRAPILDALVAVRIAAARRGGAFEDLDEATRVAILQEVEASEPAAFDALLVQSYTGYYTDAGVQGALGVPSPLMPTGFPRATEGNLDPARLDRVRATARPWREA